MGGQFVILALQNGKTSVINDLDAQLPDRATGKVFAQAVMSVYESVDVRFGWVPLAAARGAHRLL